MVGQVEVGPEGLARVALVIPPEHELGRFVLPRHAVEIKQAGELPLRVVREANQWVGLGQGYPPAPAAGLDPPGASTLVPPAGRPSSWMAASTSETTAPVGTMLSTPWPPLR